MLSGAIEINTAPPFRAFGEHIAIDLPGGSALFTTRRGGVSTGPYASLNLGSIAVDGGGRDGDQATLVAENRRLIAAQIGVIAEGVAHARQVHGSTVNEVLEPPSGAWADPPRGGGLDGLPDADGQATALPKVAVAVLVADCLPVALIGEGAVAMVHAGWRGLAGEVIPTAVRALRKLGATGAIRGAIGPGAGVCCYRVSDEVHSVFARWGAVVRQDANLDLKRVASLQMQSLGVTEIHDLGLCTICGERSLFFSHRRDGGVTGRQAGIAWRS